MSLEPVIGNSLSNTCDNPISSNCVTWAGTPVPGTCNGATLTQVIQQIQSTVNSVSECCEGSFPPGHASCWSAGWTDFTPPVSGSGVGYSYTITSATSVGIGNPQYRWTKEGDLKIRGGFKFTITPSASREPINFPDIPLVALPVTCFPSGWTSGQFSITTADPNGTAIQTVTAITTMGLFLHYPSGILYFTGGYISTQLATMTIIVGLNTTFNLA